ncbi:MAG: OadG family protein [Lachnospiraceae bacterium]|nr:OadG family protein [Lachnospiraceae bacterium]
MVLQNISEVTIPEALVHTVISMAVVFCVLILISFFIYLLKFVPGWFDGKKKEPAVKPQKAAPANDEARKEPVSASADDTQLVAVIAAAIAAYREAETGVPASADGLVIRSIKKRTFLK